MAYLLRNPWCQICGSSSLKRSKIPGVSRNCGTAVESEIVIPKRIPRGPTDILRALRTTIKRDPTAPHYKFHDDPYLIPVSNAAKRTFALSQESGRKTAMWIKEQHPELFRHIEADPPIKAYLSKAIYDETDHVDNETLSEVIKNASVNDAIHVYQLMLNAGMEVSEDNKQSLLEIICFFNETEHLAEELIEERWFSQVGQENVIKNTWRDNGFAEKLFKELVPSGKSYSALIQGMAKFNQMEKAYEFYKQALEQGISLSIDAHHAALKTVQFLREGADQKWKLIEEILRRMNDNGFIPNIRTLNVVLGLLSRTPSARDGQRFALKMITEVKQFAVEPSLGTYHFLLKIFSENSENRAQSSMLKSIMDHIEGKEFTIDDNADTLFFLTAMELCQRYLNDMNLAYRINDLLWLGRNYSLIGNSYKEASYYRHFFLLLMRSENLETILKQYDYYVPNIYTPEMSVMLEFINVVSMNGAVELFPRVWTDIVLFDFADKSNIISNLLNGMALNRPPVTSPPSELTINLAEIAWSIFTSVNEIAKTREPMKWTGGMLGNVMMFCLCAENFEKATGVFCQIHSEQNKILGVPPFEVMNMFIDACIVHQNVKFGLSCIEYCSENGYADVLNLAKKFCRGVHLSPASKSRVIAYVGQDIVEE